MRSFDLEFIGLNGERSQRTIYSAKLPRVHQEAGLTGSDARRSKAAADAVCSTDSSESDADDDEDDDVGRAGLPAGGLGSRPSTATTFQQRVASAKLQRSTPASRLARRQDSLATLDPGSLTALLGGGASRARLCSLVDAASSTEDYRSDAEEAAAETSTKNRARVKRHPQRTAALVAGSSDEEERMTTDRNSKRKPKVDRIDGPGDDDETKKLADGGKLKQEKDKRGGRRQDVVGVQSTLTRTRRQRAEVLPMFGLGEFPAARTEPSARLDAIRRSVERAHRDKKKLSPRRRGGGADRGGQRAGLRGDEELGTRTTLRTKALVTARSQFVRLKVHRRITFVEHVSSKHRHPLSCRCHHWRSAHLTAVELTVHTARYINTCCCSVDSDVLLCLLVSMAWETFICTSGRVQKKN